MWQRTGLEPWSHLTPELRAVDLASLGLSFPTSQMKMPVTPLLPAGFRPVALDGRQLGGQPYLGTPGGMPGGIRAGRDGI